MAEEGDVKEKFTDKPTKWRESGKRKTTQQEKDAGVRHLSNESTQPFQIYRVSGSENGTSGVEEKAFE